MKIQSHTTQYTLIEHTVEYASSTFLNDRKEWTEFIVEFMVRTIDKRTFNFYENRYNKRSCLQNYGQLITGKYNGVKYGFLTCTDTSVLSDIVEESDFYLGNIYMLVGDVSKNELQDFILYVNDCSKVGYVSPIECIKMDNDGDSIFLNKPLKQDNSNI